MHKPAAPALFLAGIPFAIVCASAFAQTLPMHPDTEFRAAMAWAFPLNPPPAPDARKLDMHKPLRVPGSTRTYTLADYDDMFGAPDWFPQDHSPMPQIVAHGNGDAWACAYCHLPNGQGRPENAPLAGLPAAYIIEQVQAFRSGQRTTGRSETAKFMPAEARNVIDADVSVRPDTFPTCITGRGRAWSKPRPCPRPTSRTGCWSPMRTVRASRSGTGSLKPRPTLHAPNCAIRASGLSRTCRPAASRAARRSHRKARMPTYMVRQLILFRTGQRSNPEAAPMRAEASNLTLQDMISVAAYAASRKP